MTKNIIGNAPLDETSSSPTLSDQVQTYWEKEPCGTSAEIVGELAPMSRKWFEQIEEHRYRAEPMIHAVAQFSRHAGETVLEVGVGAGTDHLQWARVGTKLYGVDLTSAAITTTKAHLSTFGYTSDLRQTNAETLPFADRSFDVVYSWGVIHHAEKPELIIAEIHRVLKTGGTFLGMMYGRHSLVAAKLWCRHGLLRFRPWMTLKEAVWTNMESVGTKAYTVPEMKKLFARFASVQAEPFITIYDKRRIPTALAKWLPNSWGWFIGISAQK